MSNRRRTYYNASQYGAIWYDPAPTQQDGGNVVARRPVLENAVMEVLWSADEWLTPGQVQGRMAGGESLAYTTVMTVMNRLWKKGRLDRMKRGRAYEYGPVLRQEEFAAAQMAEMLAIAADRNGALSHFVEELNSEDRERLRRMLEGP